MACETKLQRAVGQTFHPRHQWAFWIGPPLLSVNQMVGSWQTAVHIGEVMDITWLMISVTQTLAQYVRSRKYILHFHINLFYRNFLLQYSICQRCRTNLWSISNKILDFTITNCHIMNKLSRWSSTRIHYNFWIMFEWSWTNCFVFIFSQSNNVMAQNKCPSSFKTKMDTPNDFSTSKPKNMRILIIDWCILKQCITRYYSVLI